MKNQRDRSQLSLDLSRGTRTEICTTNSVKVVPFVDATTLRIRREAVRRMTTTGIFAQHKGLHTK